MEGNMGEARAQAREQALLSCSVKGSFYAYEPETDSSAARLLLFHRWEMTPGGTGHIRHVKVRHAVTVSRIVAGRVATVIRVARSKANAEEFIQSYTLPLERLEVTTVEARARFAELTGLPRYSSCQRCSNKLELAAPWCTACGALTDAAPVAAGPATATAPTPRDEAP